MPKSYEPPWLGVARKDLVRRAHGPWPHAEHELLLDAALLPAEAAAVAWRTWRAQRSDRAFGDVHWLESRLFAPIARRLADVASADDWLGRMHGISRHMWVQSRARRMELAPVLASLALLPAPPLLLKGEALLASGHVPDDGSRTMGDSDLLVREADMDAAHDRLAALGWHPRSPRRLVDAKRHAHTYLNATGRELDLHRWLLPLPARNMPYDMMAYHAVQARLGGVSVLVPHATELLFHVLVAARRTVEDGPPPFLWVADAVALLRQNKEPIVWPRLVEHAKRYEQTIAVRAGLRYLGERFQAPVAEDALAALDAVRPTARELRVSRRMAGPQPLVVSPRTLWLDVGDDYVARCEAKGCRPTQRGKLRHIASRIARRGPRYVGRLLRRAMGRK